MNQSSSVFDSHLDAFLARVGDISDILEELWVKSNPSGHYARVEFLHDKNGFSVNIDLHSNTILNFSHEKITQKIIEMKVLHHLQDVIEPARQCLDIWYQNQVNRFSLVDQFIGYTISSRNNANRSAFTISCPMMMFNFYETYLTSQLIHELEYTLEDLEKARQDARDLQSITITKSNVSFWSVGTLDQKTSQKISMARAIPADNGDDAITLSRMSYQKISQNPAFLCAVKNEKYNEAHLEYMLQYISDSP